jgi:hypothetical protein
MQKQFALYLIAGLALTACDNKKPDAAAPPPAPVAGGNSNSAPADYLNTLANNKKLADKVIDTASLNKAVQLFGAQEGRLPKDLNELVTRKYLPALPPAPTGMKFAYDAKTGEVKVVKQ